MARTSVKKNIIKPVNYLNKDFNDFRDNLIMSIHNSENLY